MRNRSALSRLFAVLLSGLLLAACNNRPDYVIDEETMTALLTDVHMAEGLVEVQSGEDDPDYGQKVMAAVMLKHHVTREQYDTSLVWYSQNLKRLIKIYKQVDKNLAESTENWERLAEAKREFGGFEAGDSVNLWQVNPYVVLDEARLTHYRVWTLPTDSTFDVGDTVRWQLHVGRQPEGQGIVASIALIEEQGRMRNRDFLSGVSTGLITGDTTLCLTCAGDSVRFTHIIATLNLLRVGQSEGQVLIPAVVDDIEMLRIHKK